MAKGILGKPPGVKDIPKGRRFPGRLPPLPPRWQQYYDQVVETREFAVNRRPALKYAH